MRLLIALTTVLLISGCASGPVDPGPNPVIEEQVELDVCHELPGDPDGRRVDQVRSGSALKAHLAHGDTIFGSKLNPHCEGPLTIRIDESIAPSAPYAPGFRGGPPRPLGVVVDDSGGSNEYITNEIIVRLGDRAALRDLVDRYGATVLWDDTVLIGTEDGGTKEIPGGAEGLHLISFDPSVTSVADLPTNATNAGFSGDLTFSSIEAAAAVALQLREQSVHPALNIAYYPLALNEHPDNSGGHVDFATQWWMEDGGISTSVVRALDYLRDAGLPPREGVFRPVFVAVIDAGFDLDPTTGLGSADYNNNPFTPPLQVDVVNGDGRAGGSVGGWHGQQVFGACCAYPRNGYGGAGTGGNLVRPILVQAGSTIAGSTVFFSFDVHMGLRSAWLMGADVITMSIGCDRDLLGETGPLCRLNDKIGGNLQQAVWTATIDGAVVLAAAGNGDDNNISNDDIWPCELDAVICVGGINASGNNVYNYGSGVDIYAPSQFTTTVTPTSAARDDNDVGMDELDFISGTSSAAPFVAGVAALVKAADFSLRWDDVEEILQATANCAPTPSPCPVATPDPHVHKGYVDALRAVQAVRENPPPEVRIAWPANGASQSWGMFDGFTIRVDDPPAVDFDGDVFVDSDLDGEICSLQQNTHLFFCPSAGMSIGTHSITVTATDEFGASGEAEIEMTLRNSAPGVTILSPADAATFFSSQLVTMRVNVIDLDETIADADIEWNSSVDGVLVPAVSSRDFIISLSEGTHTVTARAVDANGLEASDSVVVTILAGEGHPTSHILAPSGMATSFADTPITFVGEGTDPEDGVLPPTALQWSSDVDGILGTGPVLERGLTGPDCGLTQHTVTLEVTDSDGRQDTDSITIAVGQIC